MWSVRRTTEKAAVVNTLRSNLDISVDEPSLSRASLVYTVTTNSLTVTGDMLYS